MNTGLYVRLRPDELDRIAEIAKGERRPLRDQVAWIVAQYLNQQSKEAVLTK